MYLTAQRVQRPSTHEEAIHAFYYMHGPCVWDGLPPDGIPDENRGELASSAIALSPPGNSVRSYLDITAPDETLWTEIRPALVAFVSEAQAGEMPWGGVVGRCFFRISMEAALAADWQRELMELYTAAQAVRIGG